MTFKIEEIESINAPYLLSILKLEKYGVAKDFEFKVYSACDGEAIKKLESCNCTMNLYISNAISSIPQSYKLFKVGPFIKVDSIKVWSDKMFDGFDLSFMYKSLKKEKAVTLNITFSKVRIEKSYN